MKALSIDPEYAHYIFTGEKTVECRSWKTNYRGDVLICATKTYVPGCICGHAYFIATLTDVEPFTKKHLEAACMDEMPEGQFYAWHLKDVAPIYPIPVRGMPGLFEVADDKIRLADDGLPDDMPEDEAEKYFEDFYAKYFVPITYTPDLL